ncbi:MAG: ECF transporter S component [Ruminococcus sp.]|nr:ECF transporter S component [Ruminococcus sp.]
MIVIKSRAARGFIRLAIPFAVIPALAVLGTLVFDKQKHLIVSMAAAAFALLLFVTGFEKKSTGTRRLVIVSVMTALCFAGRFIPILKPVSALAILTGLYLGGEAGFLTGAMTAVLSNFYFGQGPWTVFQILAWGIIGLGAGILSEPLKKSRISLIIYGIVSGVAYSFIMDIWTVLWYNQSFSWRLYRLALISAIPYTTSYVVSNVVFLWLLAKPVGEKLERLHKKYGI